MFMGDMGKNSLMVWVVAMRLYSIPLSTIPVIAASVLAYKLCCFDPIPALLCLAFAALMHIVANLSNDYYDFLKGADDPTHLGFAYLVSNGLLDIKRVFVVTAGVCVLACASGLLLLQYADWWLIFVGLFCVIVAYGYTAGRYALAYHALGDLAAFVFFGLVATVFSFYVQVSEFHYTVWILGAVFGFVVVNILVVNNVRDVEKDRSVNKTTTIVLFGTRFGERFYLLNGLTASLLCLCFLYEGWIAAAILPQVYLLFHLRVWYRLKRAINPANVRSTSLRCSFDDVLRATVRNVVLLGVLIIAGLL